MLASIIFILTLICIITRPKNLEIGTIAIIGAILAYLLGVVGTSDIHEVVSIVSDATLSFVGIIITSMILDEIGFFEYLALHMIKLSGGSGKKMFIYILLLGALIAAFFANDGAALILTPIVLAKMKYINMDKKAIFAFVMAGGFIGDSTSNPLVISNLTNIVTFDYFNIGFFEYAKNMFFPNILSLVASIIVLFVYFNKSIPKNIDITKLPEPMSVVQNKEKFKISWWFLGSLIFVYLINDILKLPISIFSLGGALVLMYLASKKSAINTMTIVKNAPWQVVWFSIGLYIVVYGLKNAGLSDIMSEMIRYFASFDGSSNFFSIMGTGFLSAISSSIMNNMPNIMIMNIAIDNYGYSSNELLAYANILGSNLGPKMTPIGSLATLLWLHILNQKGIKITWLEYMKIGLVITPIVLFIALLGLVQTHA